MSCNAWVVPVPLDVIWEWKACTFHHLYLQNLALCRAEWDILDRSIFNLLSKHVVNLCFCRVLSKFVGPSILSDRSPKIKKENWELIPLLDLSNLASHPANIIEQMNLNVYQLTNFYVLSPWFILTNPYGTQITISQFIEPIQFGPKKVSKLSIQSGLKMAVNSFLKRSLW